LILKDVKAWKTLKKWNLAVQTSIILYCICQKSWQSDSSITLNIDWTLFNLKTIQKKHFFILWNNPIFQHWLKRSKKYCIIKMIIFLPIQICVSFFQGKVSTKTSCLNVWWLKSTLLLKIECFETHIYAEDATIFRNKQDLN